MLNNFVFIQAVLASQEICLFNLCILFYSVFLQTALSDDYQSESAATPSDGAGDGMTADAHTRVAGEDDMTYTITEPENTDSMDGDDTAQAGNVLGLPRDDTLWSIASIAGSELAGSIDTADMEERPDSTSQSNNSSRRGSLKPWKFVPDADNRTDNTVSNDQTYNNQDDNDKQDDTQQEINRYDGNDHVDLDLPTSLNHSITSPPPFGAHGHTNSAHTPDTPCSVLDSGVGSMTVNNNQPKSESPASVAAANTVTQLAPELNMLRQVSMELDQEARRVRSGHDDHLYMLLGAGAALLVGISYIGWRRWR